MAISELILEAEDRAEAAEIAATPGGKLGQAYRAIDAYEAAVEARRAADNDPDVE